MTKLSKLLKLWLKQIIVPIFIESYRFYLYLFYVRFKNKDIFEIDDYLRVIKPSIPFINISHLTFGIKRVIPAKYVRLVKWNTEVEHGITFGRDRVNYSYYAKNVITMSQVRANLLLQHQPALAIGPYIAYAEGVYSVDKISVVKQQLGRVLLVFPAHSTPTEAVSFDELQLIAKIEKIKHNYETVVVSLYWVDYLRNKGVAYLRHGYKIVCAGHRFDPFFLSRLRTIIELSDNCLTNGVGTHVGYCVYLRKPIISIAQSVKYDGLQTDWAHKASLDTCEGTFEEYLEERYFIEVLFEKLFANEFVITAEQIAFVEYHWGISCVKQDIE